MITQLYSYFESTSIITVFVQIPFTMDGKKNIMKILFIILTFFSIFTEITCDRIPLIELNAGDVINIYNLNKTTTEIVGNIFNNNRDQLSKYVDVEKPKYLKYQQFQTLYHCHETFHANIYPVIENSNGTKMTINNTEKSSGSFLGIDEKYVNKKYLCLSFKECGVKVEEKVSMDLIDESDFPVEVKLLTNKTGIFKVKRENETHYVSSIMTGDCVFQVLVYEDTNISSRSFLRETPIHEGRVLVSSNNKTLEIWVNDFLKNEHQSLSNMSYENKETILKQFNNAAVIKLELKSLPELPPRQRLSPPPSLTSPVPWKNLSPGATIDRAQLDYNSSFVIGKILNDSYVETHDYPEWRDYFDMSYKFFLNVFNQSQSCPVSALNNKNKNLSTNIESLSFFECKLARESYGIEGKYLNEQFKRLEVRLCRTGRVVELKTNPSLNIINLDERYLDIGNNVFVQEDILMRIPVANETHYISSITFGDCLYQGSTYHVSQSHGDKPAKMSRLISASGNSSFESWAEKIISASSLPHIGLYQIFNDAKIRETLLKEFRTDDVLSLNIDKLFKKRSLPFQPSIQKPNHGYSLTSSVISIFLPIILIKFLTD
ncbi:uncharacterized protein LOC130674400 [Microplitis mediator]|uniref:uncharacterized protein LOC130674400 n=1 Tax=Microplitis mediator TaxID=375433 RepID=UPI002553D8B2|nr:uncharacterized protein LOC130674400 [Microplitis mediator]